MPNLLCLASNSLSISIKSSELNSGHNFSVKKLIEVDKNIILIHIGSVIKHKKLSKDLEKNIIRLPFIERSEIPNIYKLIDILLFPSIYEGFGFPLVEMMSRGLPVIASNRGSLPELLSDAGLTFNPFDKDELTVKIKQMLENTKLREKFALNSLNRMDDFFDWDEYAMKLEPLYQKILSGHF